MHYNVTHWIHRNVSAELTKAHIPHSSSEDGTEVNITIPDDNATILHQIMEKFDVMILRREGKSTMFLDTHGKHFACR